MPDGVLPGNLQMNTGLEKWTVFWSDFFRMDPYLVKGTEFFMESPIGVGRAASESFYLENFQMELVLVIWMDFCTESTIGGERGVAGGVSLENIQMDPDSVMWKDFFQILVNGPRLGELEG